MNQDDRVGTNYQIQDQEVVLEGMHGTVQGQGTQPIIDSDTREQEHCEEDETVGVETEQVDKKRASKGRVM